MRLRRRVILTSLAIALPAAVLVLLTIDRVRGRDMRIALARVAEAHLTESVRDQCQLDPQWFLAGPRTGRPSLAARRQPDADVLLPRPSADELPFEVFAYNAQFSPTSTAGPRFPTDFRDAMRSSPPAEVMIGPWESEAGRGLQLARLTGWTAGPCAVLLFRMQSPPGLAAQRGWLFAGLVSVFFAAMLGAFAPTLYRMRRTSLAIGVAAKENFASVAPDNSKDEISAVAFAFNDAAREIHRRGSEIKDRREALRRLGEHTADAVTGPLVALESRLARFAGDATLSTATREQARAMLRDLHDANVRLENLAAASRLRADSSPLERDEADLRETLNRVAARYAPLAEAGGVAWSVSAPDTPVRARIHPLLERALGNLLDNAIRYSPPGARVQVVLQPLEGAGGFSIRVTDTGRGVSDDEFHGLTAIRRFRGDEGWNRRPNAPGLGLAVAREIADRSGLDLQLRRPDAGGFEAELTTVA
jgi:signal transduction histidine kinase